jgi:signal transduction histidine kinase
MNKGIAQCAPSSEGKGRTGFSAGRIWLAASSGMLAAAVFALDLWLPSSIAGGVLYIVPVLLGSQLEGRRVVLLPGILATVLTATGFMLSPVTAEIWEALSNRGLAIIAIWTVVILTIKARGAEGALRLANDRREALTGQLREARAAFARAESFAAMGQLTGTVAHELRNPLGVISTSIAVIETRTRDAKLGVEAALSRASRGIRRCENIITEHLDFARAQGHQPVSLILDYWLSGVLDEMTIAKDIETNRNLRTGGAVVRFDPESLRRALINLVDNACQAMTAKQGGPDAVEQHRLTVTSRIEGDSVHIIVADNGPGIAPDIIARITEPLFSTRASGTGLGLPVVQRIMDDHGGSLRINSMEGQGTLAILRLPHADQD